MREILFRGKTAVGTWIESDSILQFEDHPIKKCRVIMLFQSDEGWVEVIPETVGQFTGLTDKNGKQIFEGDICKHRSDYSGEYIISVVAYEDGEFLAMVGNNSAFCLSDKLEVIGNIHDNPELLN